MNRMNRNRRRRPRGGFTLMEVLLVLAILVVLGSLAFVQFSGVKQDSNISSAKTQIGLLKPAIDQYEFEFGKLPESLDNVISGPGEGADPEKWNLVIRPMLQSLNGTVPLDPWNNQYKYAAPGTHNANSYDLWSSGPDGADGTTDDVGNWSVK